MKATFKITANDLQNTEKVAMAFLRHLIRHLRKKCKVFAFERTFVIIV